MTCEKYLIFISQFENKIKKNIYQNHKTNSNSRRAPMKKNCTIIDSLDRSFQVQSPRLEEEANQSVFVL